MTVEEVSAEAFANVVKSPYHVFATASFNELNRSKTEELFFLLVKDSKVRLAIAGGRTGREFRSPFSAPFGGFVFLDDELRFQVVDAAIDSFVAWAHSKNLSSVRITLPPMLYNEAFISRQINALYRKGFSISAIDINHSFSLEKFGDDYVQSMWHNARKNFRASMQQNLLFRNCTSDDEFEEAYRVIALNREARNLPLRMTWEQVRSTADVIKAESFLVSSASDNIAAAIVFHVAPGVVQVIYWGDVPKYAAMRTMNFLSYHIFKYYKSQKINTIDIGISTENSIPNFGLCDFKESIGCDVSSKFTLSRTL